MKRPGSSLGIDFIISTQIVRGNDSEAMDEEDEMVDIVFNLTLSNVRNVPMSKVSIKLSNPLICIASECK